MTSDSFRAIIVGAGPTGLALGNLLAAANIDFIILERHRSVITESGACIMLWPHTTRVLDQLGLMDKAVRSALPLDTKTVIDCNGKQVSSDPAFRLIEQNHGYPALAYPRPELIKLLYEGLEDHMSKIKTSSYIQDIDMDVDGVQVRLKDGNVERGSLVIGCDGIHSQTRNILEREATKDGIAVREHRHIAEFECLFGSATSISEVPARVFWESHGPGVATQMASDGLTCRFSIWKRLAEPVERKRTSTENETERFMEKMGEVLMAPGFYAKDLNKYCTWKRLVYQPEGVAEQWYHDRIVLCGESVAQMTSINGMGFNVAFQSAVLLANKLHAVLKSDPKPRTETLAAALADYEETRKTETQAISKISVYYIRAATWSSWPGRVFIDYILPWFWGETGLVRKLGEGISKGRKLDFIHYEDKVGKVPWERYSN